MNKKALVREYAGKHRYFFLFQIARDTGLSKEILWNYLSQLKAEKVIFDSGYGCYSIVAKSFKMPTVEREQDIAQFIKKRISSCY